MLVNLYRSSRAARWLIDAAFVLFLVGLLGALHAAPSLGLLGSDYLGAL